MESKNPHGQALWGSKNGLRIDQQISGTKLISLPNRAQKWISFPRFSPNPSESLKKANDLFLPWITAVLAQRVSASDPTLRVVTDRAAWMGSNRTGQVTSYDVFPQSKLEASWLPDEPSSRGWRAVIGAVK
jgi:hypothetical protein